MKKYEKLIKQVYESKTLKIETLPKGTTMGMVADYIAKNYKSESGRPAYYWYSECEEDESRYFWRNGFAARIDVWDGEITIWKEWIEDY